MNSLTARSIHPTVYYGNIYYLIKRLANLEYSNEFFFSWTDSEPDILLWKQLARGLNK